MPQASRTGTSRACSVPLRPMDQAIEIASQVGPVLMLAGYLTKDYFDRRPVRVRPGERVVVRDSKGHPYRFEGPPGPQATTDRTGYPQASPGDS